MQSHTTARCYQLVSEKSSCFCICLLLFTDICCGTLFNPPRQQTHASLPRWQGVSLSAWCTLMPSNRIQNRPFLINWCQSKQLMGGHKDKFHLTGQLRIPLPIAGDQWPRLRLHYQWQVSDCVCNVWGWQLSMWFLLNCHKSSATGKSIWPSPRAFWLWERIQIARRSPANVTLYWICFTEMQKEEGGWRETERKRGERGCRRYWRLLIRWICPYLSMYAWWTLRLLLVLTHRGPVLKPLRRNLHAWFYTLPALCIAAWAYVNLWQPGWGWNNLSTVGNSAFHECSAALSIWPDVTLDL